MYWLQISFYGELHYEHFTCPQIHRLISQEQNANRWDDKSTVYSL